MPRSLEYIKNQTFQGFGCSECDWKFSPSGTLPDVPIDEMNPIDKMKRKYEAERDKEFAAHACVKRAMFTGQMGK